MKKILRMCLNWKVLATLGGIGILAWLVAPKAVLGLLPVLALLACPLSMILMMGSMGGGAHADRPEDPASARSADPEHPSLADLHDQLGHLRSQQETVAQQIARLEADRVSAGAPPEEPSR